MKHIHMLVLPSLPSSPERSVFPNGHSTPIKHSPPLPQPQTPPSPVCLYGSDSFRDLTWVELDRVCPSVSGLFSLSITSSRVHPVAGCVRISFLFKADQCSTVGMDHSLHVCSPVDGRGLHPPSGPVNDAVVNTGGHVSLCFHFLWGHKSQRS